MTKRGYELKNTGTILENLGGKVENNEILL